MMCHSTHLTASIASRTHNTTGSYIGSGATEKVLPVSRHILATMAGGAADCAFWIRHLAMQVGESGGI